MVDERQSHCYVTKSELSHSLLLLLLSRSLHWMLPPLKSVPGIWTPCLFTHQQMPRLRPLEGLHCLRLKKPFLSQLGRYSERAMILEVSFILWMIPSSFLRHGPMSDWWLSFLKSGYSKLPLILSLASCLFWSFRLACAFLLLMWSRWNNGTLAWGRRSSVTSATWASSCDSRSLGNGLYTPCFSFMQTPLP